MAITMQQRMPAATSSGRLLSLGANRSFNRSSAKLSSSLTRSTQINSAITLTQQVRTCLPRPSRQCINGIFEETTLKCIGLACASLMLVDTGLPAAALAAEEHSHQHHHHALLARRLALNRLKALSGSRDESKDPAVNHLSGLGSSHSSLDKEATVRHMAHLGHHDAPTLTTSLKQNMPTLPMAAIPPSSSLGQEENRHTPQQVAQLLSSVLVVDINHAREMIKQHPSLLALDGQQMQDRLDHLGDLLSGSAKARVYTAPALLTLSPEQLKQRLSATSQLLGISEKQLQDLAWTHPKLLVLETEVLKGNLEHLGKLLESHQSDIVTIAVAEPSLVTSSRQELTAGFNKFAGLLDLSEAKTTAIVRKNPALLVQDIAVAKSRLSSALKLLHLPAEATQELVTRVPGLLLARYDFDRYDLYGVATALDIAKERAVAVVREVPELLISGDVWQKVSDLANALKISREEAKALAADHPKLLICDTKDVKAIRNMAEVWFRRRA